MVRLLLEDRSSLLVDEGLAIARPVRLPEISAPYARACRTFAAEVAAGTMILARIPAD
jgi:hypothetical protein